MTTDMTSGLARRRFLVGGAVLGAGTLLAGCTSNEPEDSGEPDGQTGVGQGDNAAPGQPVTIGFSAPAADHGWIAAITANANDQAGHYSDVTLNAVEAGEDATAQRAAIEALIAQAPDVIVLLPHDGAQLTSTGIAAMEAGIPVVNLDREFSDPLAYRVLIKGDNYGMGVAAGHYIGQRLTEAGVTNPVIGEVAGLDFLPLTQDRTQGFNDALATYGFEVTNRVAAEFTAATGQEVTANLLQAAPQIDAIWNHDDDQGIGVLAAIQQAGRDEFFMVGGAGSRNAMDAIQADNTVLKATVTYSPTMASSAISLARLVAQNKGMGDLVERQVPKLIILASETVTRENVEAYLPLGFPS